ncbi:hypothetical protein I7I50_12017 [Histoplasma capsulatum G186AR]|uniref:Uncharacterized protein n=1 Tax=Ajellomyces capsulatus TaxID=5037 RepID=A0A8H7YEA0_AJECA|nr:hypothetical protein I7I52_11711 [Histoplasma capsulatum]QSS70396.1 hypothetical protein I7I50_12017 [Histoplasma capsulatum G186AR]
MLIILSSARTIFDELSHKQTITETTIWNFEIQSNDVRWHQGITDIKKALFISQSSKQKGGLGYQEEE